MIKTITKNMVAFLVVFGGGCAGNPPPLFQDAGSDGGDTGGDTDTDTDTDTGTGTGDPVEEGEPCEIMLWSYVIMAGDCQPTGEECPGGTFPLSPQGNCVDGLDCCILDNQCETQAFGIASCQPDPCTLGYAVGCPDHGWCCLFGK